MELAGGGGWGCLPDGTGGGCNIPLGWNGGREEGGTLGKRYIIPVTGLMKTSSAMEKNKRTYTSHTEGADDNPSKPQVSNDTGPPFFSELYRFSLNLPILSGSAPLSGVEGAAAEVDGSPGKTSRLVRIGA